jgi:hypothetical protein
MPSFMSVSYTSSVQFSSTAPDIVDNSFFAGVNFRYIDSNNYYSFEWRDVTTGINEPTATKKVYTIRRLTAIISGSIQVLMFDRVPMDPNTLYRVR